MGEANRRATQEERINFEKIQHDLVIEERKQRKLHRQEIQKQRLMSMTEGERRKRYNNRLLIISLLGSVDKWLELQ